MASFYFYLGLPETKRRKTTKVNNDTKSSVMCDSQEYFVFSNTPLNKLLPKQDHAKTRECVKKQKKKKKNRTT